MVLRERRATPISRYCNCRFAQRFITSYLSLRCSDTARVNEGSQIYLPPTRLPRTGMSHTRLYSPAAIWPILISSLAEGSFSLTEDKRLSWPGWCSEIPRWFARPKTVTHPSTDLGRWESNSRPSSGESRATSLKRSRNEYQNEYPQPHI